MATRQELLIEANRRGLLSGRQKEMYDEAVSRGLINDIPVSQQSDYQLSEVQKNIPAAVMAADLPEIGAAPELNEFSLPAFLSSLSALSMTNPAELASALEKRIPGTTITTDSEGALIANFPSGSFAINKPGLSGQDLAQFAGRAAAFTPAGLAKGGLLKSAAIVGGKSAGIESVLQGGEAALGGEANAEEVGLAAVFGSAGQAVIRSGGNLIRGIINKRRASQAATQGIESGGIREAAKAVDEAIPAQEATGVKLTRAQQTLDPFALQEQSFVADLPEGAKRALQELTKQNTEAGEAVSRFLSTIAPDEAVTRAGKRIRTAAQKAIEIKKSIRAERTSPLYKEAFQQGGVTDVQPVLDDIALRLTKYPANHPAAKALNNFADEITENAGSLQKLQGVKEVIDDNIASLIQGKPTAATNKATREIASVQNMLLEQMDRVSPLYAAAREKFEQESSAVTAIKDSILGKVSIADDQQLKSVSKSILNPAETNQKVVRDARRAILNTEGGHEAWNDLVRSEIERRLGSFRGTLDDALQGNAKSIENVPAKLLSAIAPNDKSRKVLLSAMDAQQRENFLFLEVALKRARQGRPGGSQTGVRKEISDRFSKGIVAGLRRFITSPMDTAAQIGEESARSNRIRAVADAAFDRTWSADLAKIRSMANAEQQEKAFFDLLRKTEDAAAVVTASTIQPTRADE